MKNDHRDQTPARDHSAKSGHALRRPRNHAHHRAAEIIQAQHDDLHEVVTGLKEIRDIKLLIKELRHLKTALIAHFAQEEGAEGFRPIITECAPHHLDRMHHLFGEHKAFLTTLSLLLERAEARPEIEKKAIFQEVAMFVSRLRVHEREETQLLSDSLYTDLGES